MKDVLCIDGEDRNVKDVMNPLGMFADGKRLREYSATNDPLPLSGKLIPEYFGRRNIRDMFSRKPSPPNSQRTDVTGIDLKRPETKQPIKEDVAADPLSSGSVTAQTHPAAVPVPSASSPSPAAEKRSVAECSDNKSSKRFKSGSTACASPGTTSKGQQSLKGFFRPKASTSAIIGSNLGDATNCKILNGLNMEAAIKIPGAGNGKAISSTVAGTSSQSAPYECTEHGTNNIRLTAFPPSAPPSTSSPDQETVHDPIQSKESWSKLFTKPAAPRCEGHDEPCITLLTKKAGMNLGRSFWMCPRPLGPSGAKEKNTQWRCQTFIWCSDWNPNAAHGS